MAKSIRRDDTVLVIYGRDRGKTGKVVRVLPKRKAVIVAGINQVTRHTAARQGVAQTGLVKKEAPIPLSSVQYMDPNTNKAGRVGWRVLDDLTKDRFVRNAKQN